MDSCIHCGKLPYISCGNEKKYITLTKSVHLLYEIIDAGGSLETVENAIELLRNECVGYEDLVQVFNPILFEVTSHIRFVRHGED